MADFNVIADVSRTLESVVTNGLSGLAPGPPVAEVHNLQGQISTTPARLTIFLFEVVEDPSNRNRPRMRVDAPPDVRLVKNPMSLLLRYLMTPFSGDRFTDHQILGRTLQVLYDGAVLSGPQLLGGLQNSDVALKITPAPLTLEDRSRIFSAVQRAYHLSVTYEVRVVELDSQVAATRRPVASRTLVPHAREVSP